MIPYNYYPAIFCQKLHILHQIYICDHFNNYVRPMFTSLLFYSLQITWTPMVKCPVCAQLFNQRHAFRITSSSHDKSPGSSGKLYSQGAYAAACAMDKNCFTWFYFCL